MVMEEVISQLALLTMGLKFLIQMEKSVGSIGCELQFKGNY